MNKKLTPSKIALVAEGGGMRGIFTAGVLDAFFENDFYPFDWYYGVSAGANNLSSHLAKQYQRNYRILTCLMTNPKFINLKQFIKGGHFMDLDWLFEEVDRKEPLDVRELMNTLKNNKIKFFIGTTSIETARPHYIEPDEHNISILLKASSAIPVMYRKFITVNSEKMVDGSVVDPIPVNEAYERGARTIVVIRTRAPEIVKKKDLSSAIMPYFIGNYPTLRAALKTQYCAYQKAVQFILNPPNDCNILHIAPEKPLLTGRTTQKIDSLEHDYALGKLLGKKAIHDIENMILKKEYIENTQVKC